ncbi:MAG TPA: two-component regulator propeller domain-containing protein [Rhodocyclaceae bacterium]|nr:regulator [Rhodocyclaceae bacterium]HMV53200.1 two-component regulator propeller domain-containing protein [Rhodocyclaceae bacterium]HNB77491.1 two-component regulator propeller domain-containing protein [Rhodocyclaceae bacterium]HNC60014.1 two-component regulator propeller domain-containing protein [Rhodocyclaceae bacterium]HNH11640.1 two-component regulator propeller domain-containing protein [Rhodocyclaceae bacterium]
MKWFFLGCLLLVSPAFGQSLSAAPPSDGDGILETFNVGENVYVRALAVEKASNSLWVGTSSGVNEVDLATGKLRNTFTRKDGLANEYVFGIGIDAEGHKWFGTNAGGASRYQSESGKSGKWKTYFPMHGLADYWIYAFANDKQGKLWIGTWAGANQFDPKTGKFKTYVKELVNEWVYGIDVDAKGNVWFGTEGGVSVFDGKRWRSWTHKDGLGAPNVENLPASANTGLGTRSRHDLSTLTQGSSTYNPNYVFSILASMDGFIWAGTWGGGVARFDGRKWVNFTSRDGLAGNVVYSMVRDDKGRMWFGTDRGVTRFDGKDWRSFTPHDGLLDANVYSLAVAPNGDVWAGTRRGVARIGRK